MKINIAGWFNKGNVGDETFKFVHARIFEGHDYCFVTPPAVYPEADIVVLGGGAVVSPFYLNTLPDLPRYALGVDIAYRSEIDLLSQFAFREVYVRNQTDLPDLRSKLTCPVHSMPDLAFLLQPTGQDVLGRYKRYPNKKTIGVFVTDYVNPAIDRPIEEFAAKALDFHVKLACELDLLQKEGYEIILVPCSTGGYGDDRRINFDILAYMKHEELTTNVLDRLSPQEMIDLITQMDLSLCMRFHAHIFSIIAGTPFLSFEYTRKVDLLLKENGLSDLTVCRNHSDHFELNSLTEAAIKIKGDLPDKLRGIAQNNYNRVQEVISEVRLNWLQ